MQSVNDQRGERPSDISGRPGRSGSWLQKRVGRHNNLNINSEKEWFSEESGAPGNVHRKTESETEQPVVNVSHARFQKSGKAPEFRTRIFGS